MPAASFLLLRPREVQACAGLDAAALAAVEESFSWLARGEAVMPPPMSLEVAERKAEVHVKTAYVHGQPGYAVKIASGFYANAAAGLPTSSGLMVLLSATTGFPLALLLDDGYLTDLRTALAGAVAARHLARATLGTIGVVGAGVQARLQLRALSLVRRFERVRVWGRRPQAASDYAAEMSAALGVEVVPVDNVSELVKGSDLVITATGAHEPLVRAADLHAGLHITALGSDGPGKQELEPTVLARADRRVCDRKAQCFRLGELQHALAAGLLDESSEVLELGELTSGRQPGRRDDREITVCDLTGVGVQDTAIALLAFREATARGLGTRVDA